MKRSVVASSVLLGFCCGIPGALAQERPAAPPDAPGVLRLTIEGAEKLAFKNNPQMSFARLSALASRQATREVTAGLYPNFWANLTAVDSHPGSRITAGGLNNPIIYDRAAGGVAVNQLITDFGRTSNLRESSKLRADADDERTAATAAQLTLAVDRAFYAALQMRALASVARQTVAARGAVADRIRSLAASKLKSDLDASFAAVNLAEANLLLLDAENGRRASLAALAAVLGFDDQPAFERIEEAAPMDAPPPAPDQLIAEAFSRRPELAALDLDARAAERFHIAERDLFLPNVRAMGALGAAPFRNANLGSWYGAIGVNVEIPLFNGFLFSARSSEADFKAQAARQRLRDLRNAVARDVRVSWLNASTAYSRLSVTHQLLGQAELAMELAKTRYELGLSSIVELTQAQLQQTQAQISDTEARYQYRLAEAALRFEVGGSR
jgi:outer membrane protein